MTEIVENSAEIPLIEGEIIISGNKMKDFDNITSLCDYLLLKRPQKMQVQTYSDGGYQLVYEVER